MMCGQLGLFEVGFDSDSAIGFFLSLNEADHHIMSSLFGGAGQGQGGVVGDGGLHSFKAGRCDYDSSTNTVTPVATKGSLFIQACFAFALNLRAFSFSALSPSSRSRPPSPVFVLPSLLSSSVGTPGLALAYVCLRSGVVRVVNVILSLSKEEEEGRRMWEMFNWCALTWEHLGCGPGLSASHTPVCVCVCVGLAQPTQHQTATSAIQTCDDSVFNLCGCVFVRMTDVVTHCCYTTTCTTKSLSHLPILRDLQCRNRKIYLG